MAVDVQINARQVLANLNALDARMRLQVVGKGKAAVGDELLRLSQKEVPIDEGTLANTGVSQKQGNDQVVGYNTPYAARLHEHPEYNFQRGRKGKYLEQPIKENLRPLNIIFGMEVKRQLGL